MTKPTRKTKTTTIRGEMSKTAAESLRAAGLRGENRGGDPKFSTTGHKVGRMPMRYTARVVLISRLDGADLTAADIRIARGLVKPARKSSRRTKGTSEAAREAGRSLSIRTTIPYK